MPELLVVELEAVVLPVDVVELLAVVPLVVVKEVLVPAALLELLDVLALELELEPPGLLVVLAVVLDVALEEVLLPLLVEVLPAEVLDVVLDEEVIVDPVATELEVVEDPVAVDELLLALSLPLTLLELPDPLLRALLWLEPDEGLLEDELAPLLPELAGALDDDEDSRPEDELRELPPGPEELASLLALTTPLVDPPPEEPR